MPQLDEPTDEVSGTLGLPVAGTPKTRSESRTATRFRCRCGAYPDLGIHIAIVIQDHYRITTRHKSRRAA